MAAPSSVTTSWPFEITTTGEANGALIQLPNNTPLGPVVVLKVGVRGTYTTGVLVVRARLTGMTTFFPIAGVDVETTSAVGTGGSVTLTNSTSYLFKFPVSGYDEVEVYASSLATGSIFVEQASGPADVVSPPIVNASVSTVAAGTTTITSTSASALTVGANGATNPVLKINASTSSVATGLGVTGAAEGAGLALVVISSGTDEALTINAKGSGAIGIGSVSTGAVTITPATTITGAVTCSSTLSCTAFTATSIAGTGTIAATGHITMSDAKNIVVNTSTGTKIGTATTQKLGFWNATPVVQPIASTDTSTGAAGGTSTIYLNTTFTGAGGSAAYTVGGIATALKAIGLLAA